MALALQADSVVSSLIVNGNDTSFALASCGADAYSLGACLRRGARDSTVLKSGIAETRGS